MLTRAISTLSNHKSPATPSEYSATRVGGLEGSSGESLQGRRGPGPDVRHSGPAHVSSSWPSIRTFNLRNRIRPHRQVAEPQLQSGQILVATAASIHHHVIIAVTSETTKLAYPTAGNGSQSPPAAGLPLTARRSFNGPRHDLIPATSGSGHPISLHQRSTEHARRPAPPGCREGTQNLGAHYRLTRHPIGMQVHARPPIAALPPASTVKINTQMAI
jgi:hypothetical protein